MADLALGVSLDSVNALEALGDLGLFYVKVTSCGTTKTTSPPIAFGRAASTPSSSFPAVEPGLRLEPGGEQVAPRRYWPLCPELTDAGRAWPRVKGQLEGHRSELLCGFVHWFIPASKQIRTWALMSGFQTCEHPSSGTILQNAREGECLEARSRGQAVVS